MRKYKWVMTSMNKKCYVQNTIQNKMKNWREVYFGGFGDFPAGNNIKSGNNFADSDITNVYQAVMAITMVTAYESCGVCSRRLLSLQCFINSWRLRRHGNVTATNAAVDCKIPHDGHVSSVRLESTFASIIQQRLPAAKYNPPICFLSITLQTAKINFC